VAIRLENWRYTVRMCCSGDSWCLSGEAYGHPRFPPGHSVSTSSPVSFNKQDMVVTTYSGSIYKLGECAGNLEEQLHYIEEDVERARKQMCKV
jgi:hypothetical protein